MNFKLNAPFQPTGDQPEAIRQLIAGIQKGYQQQVLLGATGTGKSIGYDDPIYVLETHGSLSKTACKAIGPWVDDLFAKHSAVLRREGSSDILDLADIGRHDQTYSFNPATGEALTVPIKSLVRHPTPALMYRLETTCGRTVTLTGDHNLWVLRQGKLTMINTSDARPDDYLPIPDRLPCVGEITTLDTLDILKEERLFVEAPEVILNYVGTHGKHEFVQTLLTSGLKAGEARLRAIRNGGRGRGLQVSTMLKLLQRTDNLGDTWGSAQASVGGKKNADRLPSSIQLTPAFLGFLGFYIAEGNCQKRYFILANHAPEIRAAIDDALSELGIHYILRPNSDFQVSSAALTSLCRRLCGSNAHEKRLPEFWARLSQDALRILLQAYFDGDGTVGHASEISATTASRQLASDLAYALLRFGIWARIHRNWKRATNSQHPGDWYFKITISGQENLCRFEKEIGFRLPHKRQALIAQCQRAGNSNVDVIPIDGLSLRQLRTTLGLSAEALGERALLSRGAVQAIEINKRRPQRTSLKNLLAALRVEAEFQENTDPAWWHTWNLLDHLCYIHWTPVASIKPIAYAQPYVYDLSVPGPETFVAGWGGLFVHNTFTMASIIQELQKPALVMAHNKTLAAQLYAEFKDFFPENAVEYFVSYYDYYQPEAYVPRHDLYIEKEVDINQEIERLRLAATTSLMSRKDVIIVASVSCIYGLGSPEEYGKGLVQLRVGGIYRRNALLRQMVESQYERNDMELRPGTFRVRGDTLEVIPAYQDRQGFRITFFGDEIERIIEFDAVTGELKNELEEAVIYPAKHYLASDEKLKEAIADIEKELHDRISFYKSQDKFLEAQRIEQRTMYDLEMLREVGYCAGIENYSRHLDRRAVGTPPWTLIDFLPSDYLLVIDESHMSVPQIRGMYNGDRARKSTLVEYGFRLPSAVDNRPLTFKEFEEHMGITIYTSATPGPYEMERADQVVEQIIRPTGLVDPEVEVRPVEGQVDDLIKEIRLRVEVNQRVLVTTLTKRMAEKLADYLMELGIKVHYLHSEVETLERIGILRDLRLGVFDVVVGINLLREGLDLPEVSLVAILDADKEGFLRSGTALIQTIGRAARHIDGKVIMYADKMTDSMKRAIDETNRRRAKQSAYNESHNIRPVSIFKAVRDLTDQLSVHTVAEPKADYNAKGSTGLQKSEIQRVISELEKQMKEAAKNLEFEKAAVLRDQVFELRSILAEEANVSPWEKIRLLTREE